MSVATPDESQDLQSSWTWPVRWTPAVERAARRGQDADVLSDDPEFAAHRILDKLAALAFAVDRGAPDAPRAFLDAVDKLIGAAPWVTRERSRPDAGAADSKHAPEHPGERLVTNAQNDGGDSFDDSMIDSAGVIALMAIATRLAGKEGARAILEVSAAAIGAEQWLPGLTHGLEAGYRADIATLAGELTADTPLAWARGRTSSSIGAPAWEKLSALAQTRGATANQFRCLKLFDELTDDVGPAPQPNGAVLWTTGIDHVEVNDPCGASPLLTIHGQGFGSAAPGVGVVAAAWDEKVAAIVYRPVPVVSWSDTQVVVKLGANATGGVVSFADVAFIKSYDQWAEGENQRVATAMHAAGCPGYGPPARPKIWRPWSETPAHVQAAAYNAGVPRIVTEITLDPLGQVPELWNDHTVHLGTGQPFWVLWTTGNAATGVLRPSGAAAAIFVAAGHPASGIAGTSGSVRLVAPSQPAVVELMVEASNAACGMVQVPLRLVVTGPAMEPISIEVQQSLPGGDVSVVMVNGMESLNPSTGISRSIPFVAHKRSVARIGWWTAFPQVPAAEPLIAEASLRVSGPAIPGPGITLRPGTSTANPPPTASDPPVVLKSGRPFASVPEYNQWIAQSINNNPATFNVVLPAELCVGQVALEATVRARNQHGRLWTATATRMVEFHQRRRVLRIRYQPWGWTTNLRAAQPAAPPLPAIPAQPANPAPTDQQCEAALRGAASLLPIPDPELVRLPGPAFERGTNDKLIETIWSQRLALFMVEKVVGNNPDLRDEIWLVVGPQSREGTQQIAGQMVPTGALVFGSPGVGGYAPGWAPWTASTAAWATVTAHEIAHHAPQDHVDLCTAGGDAPASLPDNGNVVVIGWDMWNNRPVRGNNSVQGAIDLMSYCWGRDWISPQRWRRIFLQIGP